jgi:hypothetical protein
MVISRWHVLACTVLVFCGFAAVMLVPVPPVAFRWSSSDLARTPASVGTPVRNRSLAGKVPLDSRSLATIASVSSNAPIATKRSVPSPAAKPGEWQKRLFTPTYIAKFGKWWFIVSCWHHRVIYSANLDAPIGEWRDLVDGARRTGKGTLPHEPIKLPHSITTDGKGLLVVESSVGCSDGANHSVVVYRLANDANDDAEPEFQQEVTLCKGNTARRPHRVEYYARTSEYFVYLTNPGTLARVKFDASQQRLGESTCTRLPFMKGVYARSFTVRSGSDPAAAAQSEDDVMYITAGPSVINAVSLAGSKLKHVGAYSVRPLGFSKGTMNDLQFIDGWWYATSTRPCGIVRFKELHTMRPLESLTKGLGMCRPIDMKATRCTTGTPYFVTQPEPSTAGSMCRTSSAAAGSCRSASDARKARQSRTWCTIGVAAGWNRKEDLAVHGSCW